MTQVGIIVDDIEEAAETWSNFLGMDVVPGITVELIESLEGPSTWREFLEKYGPGIHHIAFNVEKTKPPQTPGLRGLSRFGGCLLPPIILILVRQKSPENSLW